MTKLLLLITLGFIGCEEAIKQAEIPKHLDSVPVAVVREDSTMHKLKAFLHHKHLYDSIYVECLRTEAAYYQTGNEKLRKKYDRLQDLKVKYAKLATKYQREL
jgi:hypothetical protein